MLGRAIILLLALGIGPAAAQQGQPRSFADCQKAYDTALAAAVKQTNRDLRESQHRAGLVRLRCERAVERKQVQDRAKKR
ncbi:MAG: hypothetical protein ACKO1J_08905 [Tagaea sp.]